MPVPKFTRINCVGPVQRPRVPGGANPRANEVFVGGREDGRTGGQEGEKGGDVGVLLCKLGNRWWL